MMAHADLDELRILLEPHVADIAMELLPGGKRHGTEWKVGGSASPVGEPISVVICGQKRGVVSFWGSGRHGTILDLIREVNGWGWRETIADARRRAGLSSDEVSEDPERVRRRLQEVARIREAREREASASALYRMRAAAAIWEECAQIAGTPAEAYLLGRKLPAIAWPLVLGCHPRLRHPAGGAWPCLVARRWHPDTGFAGIWRIWVSGDGKKAPCKPQKMGLGEGRGSAVRLPGFPDAPAGSLAISEGLETTLGVRALMDAGRLPKARQVWAGLSAWGIQVMEVPPEVRSITIYADGDKLRRVDGEPTGRAAAEKAAQRFVREGREASVFEAPRDKDFLDVWHDALLAPDTV